MKKLKLRLGFVLVVITLLLIFLNIFKILTPLENFLKREFLVPIQRRIYNLKMAFSKFTSFFLEKNKILKENEELRKINSELLQEKARIEILRRENEALRKELDFIKKERFNYLIGEIIGRAPLEQIFIIDQGEERGVKVGDPVVSDGNLIGKIVKVNKHDSQVLLLSSSHSSVASLILGKQETTGLVKGEKGLILKMDFILPEKEIEIGDLVVSSGWEENVPKGLLIGKVREVLHKEGDILKKAIIQPLIDYDEVRIVTILIKK